MFLLRRTPGTVPVLPSYITRRTQFQTTYRLLAVRVPIKETSKVIQNMKEHCWHKTKTVLPDENPENRLVLLDSNYPQKQAFLKDLDVIHHEVTVGYEHMSAEVLKQIVPPELELVTSYEMVGHIAHMNLKEDILLYKHIIGQKNKILKTVVNKTGEINTVYRTFEMELIAGENDMNTEVHETGCRFQFNFAEVYWNSRLGSEHARIVDIFEPGQIVADMFCGVGPFAIPAAKKGVVVHANDLNPRSYHYLVHNGKINKCTNSLNCYNMDGRQFMKMIVRENKLKIDHVVMNLPASAVSFLDVFLGLFEPETDPETLPFVHCYGFSNASDPSVDILQQAEGVLGLSIPDPTIVNVRNVSVGKYMMRLTFKLPPTILTTTAKEGDEQEPRSKKQKVEESN